MSEVLGVTVGVVAGLLTVALCHYLGVVRLRLMLAFPIPCRYEVPREPTGKIV